MSVTLCGGCRSSDKPYVTVGMIQYVITDCAEEFFWRLERAKEEKQEERKFFFRSTLLYQIFVIESCFVTLPNHFAGTGIFMYLGA